MCVAIYKPSGAAAPSLDVLRQCWDANPDGAGFAYNARKGGLAISKGFMTWDSFAKAYKSLGTNTKHLQMFFHFRIATHGSVKPGNCHPFPVSDKLSELQACHGRYDAVLMHNGVLSITPVLKDTSDSQELARRLAAFMKESPEDAALLEAAKKYPGVSEIVGDLLKKRRQENLLNAIRLLGELVNPSKVAIWVDMKVYLLGNWIKHDDCYFSNLTWQYSYKRTSKIGYNSPYSTYRSGSSYSGTSYGGPHGWYDGYDDYDYDYSGGGCGSYRSKGSATNNTATPAVSVSANTNTAGSTTSQKFESVFKPKDKPDTDADPMWADPDEIEAVMSGICPICTEQLINANEGGGVCQKCNIEWIIDPDAPGCEELRSLLENTPGESTESTSADDTDTREVKLLPNDLTEGGADSK